jgi:hypothetical protein
VAGWWAAALLMVAGRVGGRQWQYITSLELPWWAGVERQTWAFEWRCHTEEFYVEVLKFEIMNSWKLFNYSSRAVPWTIKFVTPVTLSPGWFKNSRFKINRTMLNLQVKIRDCWVLVGPYPSCTQTSAAATGIFEGGVGNPTRNLWVGYPFTLLLRVKASPPAIMHFKSSTLKIVLNQLNPIRWSCSQRYRQSRPCPLLNDNHEHRL